MFRKSTLDASTRTFTQGLRIYLREQGYEVGPLFESGNVNDGPGWVVEATDKVTGLTFNVEVAGPAYTATDRADA